MTRSYFYIREVILLLNFFNVLSEPLNVRQIEQNLQERIDSFVKNVYLPSLGTTGCGLAVVQNDGQLLYTTGYGYADISQKIPNRNQTQFFLASTSKSIASVVVVHTLHKYFPELDESVLDIPIRDLMPQVNFTLNDKLRSEHTTFRDLLSHKMCLPRDDFFLVTEAFDSTAEILYRQRYAKEDCGFRSQFLYSNPMVLLATELIGQLVNENFVDYTEKFLKELGMRDAAYIRKTDDFSKMDNRALPFYVVDGVRYPTNPDLIKRIVHTQAIGGLYASPNDMAQFMRFQLNMGEVDGKQVVPRNVMSWLSKPSNGLQHMKFKNLDDNGPMDSNLAYGLGLIIGTYDGWERISHNGFFPPYRNELSWYPALQIGIFSVTHEAPNVMNNAALHTFIFEALRGNANAEQIATKLLKHRNVDLDDEFEDKRKGLEIFGMNINRNGTFGGILSDSTLIGKYGDKVIGQVEVFRK